MERKIGEIFEYNGEWYQCVNQNGCCNCAFYNTPCHLIDELSCNSLNKKRKEKYIFKKLEKVGEPTMLDGKLVQKILTTDRYSCNGCCFESPECDKADNDLCCVHEIYVEIKQNKEDMEENNNAKHSNSENIGKNLKEFNLEAAKAGKPVCTRDGRPARIICFDRVTNSTNEYTGHLIVLVTNPNGDEQSFYYTEKGNLAGEDEYDNHKWDLMMLPEKKEGWAKVRKDINLYDTKEEADRKMIGNDEYVTAKVFWEE